MLFKDLNFEDKQKVMKKYRNMITEYIRENIDKDISIGAMNRYVEYLIEDTHYDTITEAFYEPKINKKLSIDFMSVVAYEYILDHIKEFEK